MFISFLQQSSRLTLKRICLFQIKGKGKKRNHSFTHSFIRSFIDDDDDDVVVVVVVVVDVDSRWDGSLEKVM